MDKAGIQSDLIWVEGDTRISHIIVETAHRRHSHIITPGYEVDEEDCQEFTARFKNYLPEADWVIIAGTLPLVRREIIMPACATLPRRPGNLYWSIASVRLPTMPFAPRRPS